MRILLISLIAILLQACASGPTTTAELYQGQTDQQIYESATENMRGKHYEQAVKDYEALDSLYPFGNYSQQGQLDIIMAYYENEDKDAALAAADRYIRLYPRANNVDYAYYLKGVINAGPPPAWYETWLHAEPENRDVISKEQALQEFQTFIQQFPKSQYVPQAQQQIMALNSLLAQHELEIAQYYLNRKVYVAAVNRATQLIKDYPDAPQVPAARQVIAKGYQALQEPNMLPGQ